MRKLTLPTACVAMACAALVLAGCDAEEQAPADDPIIVVPLPDGGTPDAAAADDDGGAPDGAVTPDAEADAGPPVDAEVPLEDLTLNSLVPNRGLAAGGYDIRVIGTGFVDGMIVAIGGQDCLALQVESANRAICTVPNGAAGPATVALSRIRGDDAQRVEAPEGFTYFEPVEIAAALPGRVPLRGGVEVVLQGTGLIEGSQVTIAGQRVANVVANADGSLSVFAPAAEPGPQDIEVVNFNGRASLPGGLFYYEDLAVDVIDPPIGPTAGGVDATLRGTGLTRDALVLFGERGAEVQDADDARRRLDVLVPAAGGPGPVDVTVENANGELTVPGAFVYFDPAAQGFQVAGVAPASGPVEGGAQLFVAGSGFGEGTTVAFDGRPLDCDALDGNRLRCTTPPGDIGPVDVEIADGAERVVIEDGYTYFQTLEIITIIPDRGAVAGGALVTVSGTGFVPDMTVNLGEVELEDVQVIDETTLVGVTPANSPGPVDVRARTAFSRSTIPAGFTYFDPTSDFGGVWGEAIEGAVNVTVINAANGAPEADASVLVFSGDGALQLEGLSNAQGQLTLSDPALRGPVNVTAAKEGFEATTIEEVVVENTTILLQPNDGEGTPPPGVPAAILRGTVTGLDVLPKPANDIFVNILVVETTHTTPYNRNRLPPPGPGGLLLEDGPFEIIARPGELALVATVGAINRDTLKDYEDGLIDYWSMRLSLDPIAMGIRRFVSASPGDQIDGLDLAVDHPMDLLFPADLDNPPRGAPPGPDLYAILPRLNFGAEGYWELDAQSIAVDPAITVRKMPRLDGWPGDISYYLIALAFSATADNTPMTVTIEETRDVEAGVFITPFVGAPFVIDPGNGVLGPDRRVTWGVADGFDGPIRPPHANLVTIEEPQLGPPKPLWRYVTPSLVTEFEVPELPAEAGATGLGGGVMILTISPFISEGPFDFDNFTYNDLNRWKSWGVTSTTFTP